jgi:predicted component of type VI protein secretion system
VEAALREFDPETLRKQLSPGKSRLPQFFDSSRMWEAYVERYEKQGAQMADWLEKIFARHFVPAYSKESERLKMINMGTQRYGGTSQLRGRGRGTIES